MVAAAAMSGAPRAVCYLVAEPSPDPELPFFLLLPRPLEGDRDLPLGGTIFDRTSSGAFLWANLQSFPFLQAPDW